MSTAVPKVAHQPCGRARPVVVNMRFMHTVRHIAVAGTKGAAHRWKEKKKSKQASLSWRNPCVVSKFCRESIVMNTVLNSKRERANFIHGHVS